MTDAERHQRIYDLVPEMECKEGCTDCCGPVPLSNWERDRIGAKNNLIYHPVKLECPYIKDGQCSVYEKRPFLCRLFGTVDTMRLRCPHGRKPDKPLTEQQGMELIREYTRIVKEQKMEELVDGKRD